MANRGAGVASAVFGVVAMVGSVGAFVLTDDGASVAVPASDVPGGSAGPGTGSVPGTAGGVRPQAPAAGFGDPRLCSVADCPGSKAPEGAPGPFPFPPSARDPKWTNDFCVESLGPGDTVKSVRMKVDDVRDWYLTNLHSYGYGWGAGTEIQANPWQVDEETDTKTPLGWGGVLSIKGDDFHGRLSMERGLGPQSVCGPAPGEVYIEVSLG